ncbi:hypothetical protein EQV77_16850 [Halobacillus fulvus]|nr:hypothetical protein EQV77_16850 [Halobacillus fulvus]
MPKDSTEAHVESTPHRDGRKDTIINDEKGKQISVSSYKKEKIELVADEKMREFKGNMENS